MPKYLQLEVLNFNIETNWIPDTTKITVQEARRPKPFIKKPVESAYGSSYVPPRPKSVAVGQNSQYSKYSPKMVPRNEYYKTPQIVKPAPVTNKKPGEDVERNDRHGAVVALLSGRRKLPFAFTSRYKLGEVLGDGAFGFVMTAKSLETGKEVAIKFIIKAKIPKDNWDRESGLPVEVLMLSRLKHPNIIKFVEYFTLEDYILLITELHGCEWNVSNPILSPEKNQGLRDCPRAKTPSSMEAQMECSPLFRLTEEQEKEIKRRTSCDLFECIDARTFK